MDGLGAKEVGGGKGRESQRETQRWREGRSGSLGGEVVRLELLLAEMEEQFRVRWGLRGRENKAPIRAFRPLHFISSCLLLTTSGRQVCVHQRDIQVQRWIGR